MTSFMRSFGGRGCAYVVASECHSIVPCLGTQAANGALDGGLGLLADGDLRAFTAENGEKSLASPGRLQSQKLTAKFAKRREER